jgi:hypothetical protein
MGRSYFIRRGENVVGPYTSPKLNQEAHAGALLKSDLISRSESGPWTVAGQVKGLDFPADAPLAQHKREVESRGTANVAEGGDNLDAEHASDALLTESETSVDVTTPSSNRKTNLKINWQVAGILLFFGWALFLVWLKVDGTWEAFAEDGLVEVAQILAMSLIVLVCSLIAPHFKAWREKDAWQDRWNSDRRVWNDKSGKFAVGAVFDEHTKDNQVRILRIDKSEIIIPFADLSVKDQKYINDFDDYE